MKCAFDDPAFLVIHKNVVSKWKRCWRTGTSKKEWDGVARSHPVFLWQLQMQWLREASLAVYAFAVSSIHWQALSTSGLQIEKPRHCCLAGVGEDWLGDWWRRLNALLAGPALVAHCQALSCSVDQSECFEGCWRPAEQCHGFRQMPLVERPSLRWNLDAIGHL